MKKQVKSMSVKARQCYVYVTHRRLYRDMENDTEIE